MKRRRPDDPDSGDGSTLVESTEEFSCRAVNIVKNLNRLGVSIPRGSRYERYVSEARRVSTLTTVRGQRLHTWHRAILELEDLAASITVLSATPEVLGWRQLVAQTFSGGVARGDEVRHSRARDIQFELALATILRRAGYSVTLAEPDVVAVRGDKEFGFAAKRPRSQKKVASLIKSADEQLVRANKHGLIAIDISCLVGPLDETFFGQDPGVVADAFTKVADDFAVKNAPAVRQIVTSSHTFGMLVHVAVPVSVRDGQLLGFVRRWTVTNIVHHSDPRTALLRGLAHRLVTSVPAG